MIHLFHGTSSQFFTPDQNTGGLEMPVLTSDRNVAMEQAKSIAGHYGGHVVILVVTVKVEKLKPIGVRDRHLAIYQGHVFPDRIQTLKSPKTK